MTRTRRIVALAVALSQQRGELFEKPPAPLRNASLGQAKNPVVVENETVVHHVIQDTAQIPLGNVEKPRDLGRADRLADALPAHPEQYLEHLVAPPEIQNWLRLVHDLLPDPIYRPLGRPLDVQG